MSWNYRVVRQRDSGDEWYSIHEVHYDESGNVIAATEHPTDAGGESLEQLTRDLEYMTAALHKPVLNYEEIGMQANENTETPSV